MAFERFVQTVLIGHEQADIDRIREIYEALRDPSLDDRLHIARRRLRSAVGEFLGMVPDPPAP